MWFLRGILACLIFTGLTSCSRDGPSDDEITRAVQSGVSQFQFTLSSVEVTPVAAVAGFGNEGPTHKIAYTGVVSLTEPLWQKIDTSGERQKHGVKAFEALNFIVKLAEQGAKARVMGTCYGKKLLDAWRLECQKFEDMSPKITGLTRSNLGDQYKYFETSIDKVGVYFTALAAFERAYEKSAAEFSGGRYAEALRLLEEPAAAIERAEIQATGNPGVASAQAFNVIAYKALFAKDFGKALSAAKRAAPAVVAFGDDDRSTWQLIIASNHAHALMCLGRTAEARAIYAEHHGQKINDQHGQWETAILKDFKELKARGVTCPHMAEILSSIAMSSVAPENNYRNGCGPKARKMWEGLHGWGAVATGDTDCGYSWAADTKEQAEARALEECNNRTTSCRITEYNR
jgi:hypothetical protein